MGRLVIKNWAESDRPREKLVEQGRRALSDAELLAILISSGSTDESAVSLCRRILSDANNNLNQLSKKEITELCRYKGIGKAKAIAIMAALELGRRRDMLEEPEKAVLNSSDKAYAYFRSTMVDLPHEEFWVIYLNTACKVIQSKLIGRGGNDFTPVDLRVILGYALECRAHAMILAHNHPSGSLHPSQADRTLTKNIVRGAKAVDVAVHDHLIFTDTAYYSFRDAELL